MKPITVKRNGGVLVHDLVHGGRIKRILAKVNNNRDMCKFINKNNNVEALSRIEKFLRIKGGEVPDIDTITQEEIPRVETVKPLLGPRMSGEPKQIVEQLTPATIKEPKGIWFFWHSQDLSPTDLHGGASKATRFFRKVKQEVKKVKRIFQPVTRTDSPLASINPNEPIAPYITIGQENRLESGVNQIYDVVTVSCYYRENMAIGIGWELRPRDKNLGYHPHDIEFVSIYYKDSVPIKVFFSQHSVGKGEGKWMNYKDCEFRDGYLVVYVARNSHSMNPRVGTQVRIGGFANDVIEASGPNKPFRFIDMIPSYNWTSSNGIKLYKSLRPQPPSESMSQRERILRF